MGPPSYMRFVVDRNVDTRRVTVEGWHVTAPCPADVYRHFGGAYLHTLLF